MPSTNSKAERVLFITPLFVIGILFCLPALVSFDFSDVSWGLGLVLIALSLPMLFDTAGRYLSLCTSLLVWFLFFALIAIAISSIAPIFVWLPMGICCFLMTFWAGRVGVFWGRCRYNMLAAKGKPIREWEWVYTGAEYTRRNQFGTPGRMVPLQLFFSFYCVFHLLSFVAIVTALVSVSFPSYPSITYLSLSAGVIFIDVIILVGLWRRWPATYLLMFILFLSSVPISIPFLFIWVESRRVNLVYQHRFERLIPIDPNIEVFK